MLTYATVFEIIENGRWGDFIGEVEGDSLDGKREIYDLSVDAKKMELAKDVSSFANAAGGFIIVGIETKKSALHFSDEVVSLKPFEAKHFNPEQYRNVLDSWIYPKIGNIKIEWKEEAPGLSKGFGVINIPPQSEETKPFLIKHTVLASGKKSDIVFGYAERKLDVSAPASIFELHQLLRDGQRYNKLIGARFDALEAQLEMSERAKPRDFVEIKARIQEALTVNGLNTYSHFALAAYPSKLIELPNFFSTKPDSIMRKLENPPKTRGDGFVMIRSATAKIVAGQLWRVDGAGMGSKVVDLYSDGALVFGCRADSWFLGWGTNKSQINTLALIEVVYNFCLFYAEVIKEFPQPLNQLHFRFEFGNMHPPDGKPAIYLVPFAVSSFPTFPDAEHQAPTNNGEGEIKIPGETFEPAEVAFKVVEKIYQWFGFTSDVIPYSEEVNSQKIISFANLGGQSQW